MTLELKRKHLEISAYIEMRRECLSLYLAAQLTFRRLLWYRSV